MRINYSQWVESLGVPIYKGYYNDDLRTVKLGFWKERGCHTAFLQLAGQEDVGETRVTEISPGESLPPWNFALDEVVYVADGQGLTTVWDAQNNTPQTFEWQKHSLFLLPRHCPRQLSNVQGDKSARLFHYNYLPLAMQAVEDPQFFLNNPYRPTANAPELEHFYSEAKAIQDAARPGRLLWWGNFFPDMTVWDRLDPHKGRGAGGRIVAIRFPNSPMTAHMSVFPAKTYKKAHRHGPGYCIVIPAGEGYSIMWEEGKDKIIIPWHEASIFVPPNRWFHQHFNLGAAPARYLAVHPPPALEQYPVKAEEIARDQIEYPYEDPWIRQKFEDELAKRGLTSIMPEQAYQDRNFEWNY